MAAGGCLKPMPLALYRSPAPITQGLHQDNELPARAPLSVMTTTLSDEVAIGFSQGSL
jgi:hypothetical protein